MSFREIFFVVSAMWWKGNHELRSVREEIFCYLRAHFVSASKLSTAFNTIAVGIFSIAEPFIFGVKVVSGDSDCAALMTIALSCRGRQ